MRKFLFLFLVLPFAMAGTAQAKIIENPAFEFTTTGIAEISKIETSRKATRVYFSHKFLPGWWVKYDKTSYLEDAQTGKRYDLLYLENGTLGREIVMPSSGSATIVAVFAPLDRKTSKLNFVEDGETVIWGISLSEKDKIKDEGNHEKLYPWLVDEVGEYTPTLAKSFSAPDFFDRGTARLTGFINGYDTRAGFSTGFILNYNLISDNPRPILFEIDEQGRFSVEIPLEHPKMVTFIFNHKFCEAYLEPGTHTGMIIDWRDFLLADRYRDEPYRFAHTKYIGSLGHINNDIVSVRTKIARYTSRQQIQKNNSWEAVSYVYLSLMEENLTTIENALLSGKISQCAHDILSMTELNQTAVYLLSYEMARSMDDSYNSRTQRTPVLFYEFLQDMPLDNPGFLIASDLGFLGLLEFMPVFDKPEDFRNYYKIPEIGFADYLLNETQAVLGEEYEAYMKVWNSLKKDGTYNPQEGEKSFEDIMEDFFGKYKNEHRAYDLKYNSENRQISRFKRSVEFEDSVYYTVLGLEPSLMYEMAKVKKLADNIPFFDPDDYDQTKEYMCSIISNPRLKEEVVRICDEASIPSSPKVMPLTQGKGADIIKSMTDSLKGRMVVIGFWERGLSASFKNQIVENKERRLELEKQGDIAFVLFTREDIGEEEHDSFVDSQQIEHASRVTGDQWNYLMQLFDIPFLPYYAIVDREGNLIIDDQARSYGLSYYLDKYLETPEEN